MRHSPTGLSRFCTVALLGACWLVQPGVGCALACALGRHHPGPASAHHGAHRPARATCHTSLRAPSPVSTAALSPALPVAECGVRTPAVVQTIPHLAPPDARVWAVQLVEPPPPRA